MRVDTAALLGPMRVAAEKDLELDAAVCTRGLAADATSAGRGGSAPDTVGQPVWQAAGSYGHAGFLAQGSLVVHCSGLQWQIEKRRLPETTSASIWIGTQRSEGAKPPTAAVVMASSFALLQRG
jgi:hypothetical protein